MRRVTRAAGTSRRFGWPGRARQRATGLAQAQPDAGAAAGIDAPRLYGWAIDALYLSGDNVHAGAVAEETCRRFASHHDPAIAAVVRHRAAYFRALDGHAADLPLLEEALRLYGQGPPSSGYADALRDYASLFMLNVEGRLQAGVAALSRAMEIAEAAGAAAAEPWWRRAAGYGNEAVLPSYLLHEPVIVPAAWSIVRWNVPFSPSMRRW